MALIKHDERYGQYMTANNAPAPFVATASQNNWGAYRAFSESLDDDISFTGLAAGAEQWVQIKLDAPIRIWAFRIACRTTVSAKDSGQVPKNFVVQGSVDGAAFEDIQTYTDVDWSQFTSWDATNNKYDWSAAKKIEIACAKEYQYYRFLFGECQAISTQKQGSMIPTSANTIKPTLIDLYQVEGEESPEITVTGIRITHQPDKTSYEVGTELDTTGLEVTADMSDGTAQAVTDYTLSGYDSSAPGDNTITVSYQGFTAAFTVTVVLKEVTVTGIRITHTPDIVRYEVGAGFDVTGLEVTADLSDSSTQVVTDYTLSGYDSATAGTKTITATYQGHTATFVVTVYELSSIVITTLPAKVQYNVGDTLDLTGMVVTATYSDGVTGAVTDYTVSGFDSSVAGTCTVTVTYQGASDGFEVTVAKASVLGITLESLLNTTEGMEVIRNGVKNDDDTDTFTGVDWFTYAGNVCSTIYVSGNNWIGFGTSSEQLKICRRDGAVYYVYRQEGALDNGTKFLKLRVEGYTYYSGNTDAYRLIYEVFLFDDGCLYINVVQSPTNSSYIGTSSITDGANTATLNIPVSVTAAAPVEITIEGAGSAQVITYERYAPFVVARMEITTPPTKTTYYGNELFNGTGIIISCVGDDGRKKAISDYSLSGFDSSVAGINTITVTKDTFTATFDVIIRDILITGIEITKLPDKVEYILGETLDAAGLEVSFVLSDATKAAADRYAVESLDSAAPGEKQVTVTYGNFTGTFSVTVLAPQSLEITQMPSKALYIIGEKLDITGIIVSEVYSNGEKKAVSGGYEVSALDSTGYGSKIITVSWQGLTATFTVEVSRYTSAQIGSPNPSDVVATLDTETGVLTILGTGAMEDWTTILQDYNRLFVNAIIENGITNIGAFGFLSCTSLTSVTIPDSVTRIADHAFTNCTSLTSVAIPEGITYIEDFTFAYCTGLTSVTIPGSVTAIGDRAFKNCAMTDVTIPYGITYFNEYAFEGCESLTDIYIQKHEGEIGGEPWGATYATVHWVPGSKTGIEITTRPDKTQYNIGDAFDSTGLVVTAIYDNGRRESVSYYNLSEFDSTTAGVKTITVSYEGLTATFEVTVMSGSTIVTESIGSPNPSDVVATLDTETWKMVVSGKGEMLPGGDPENPAPIMPKYRERIKECVVQEGITNISEAAFISYIAMTSISLPESLGGMLNNCFSNCIELQEVEVPGGISDIKMAFNNCTKLKKVVLHEGLEIINYNSFCLCTSLESVNFPLSLREINGGATFYDTPMLKEVYIPAAEVIGQSAFGSAGGLEKVTLGPGVQRIVEGAFSYNDKLTDLRFENGIKVIMNGFGACTALINVTLPESLETLGGSSFGYCTSLDKLRFNGRDTEITSVAAVGDTTTIVAYFGSKPHEWAVANNRRFEPIDALESILITALPVKTDYTLGEELGTTGIVVTAIYDTGAEIVVTDYTLSGFDSTTEGSKTVTVTYQGFSDTFEVRVHGAVTGIRIAHYPDKVYYKINDALDTTGLQVVAITEGGLERPITDYTLSALDSNTVGIKYITITYEVPVSADTNAVYFAYFAVKVTATGDNPFEDITIPFKISVHWPNGEFEDLQHGDIGTGSFALQQSICSKEYFIFGGCISSQLSFSTHHRQFLPEGVDLKDTEIEAYIESGATKVKVFTGTIDSGKRDGTLLVRKVIAYDKLYRYRNTDISRWYKNITADKNRTYTMKQFRELLFEYLGITCALADLHYDAAHVPDNNLSSEMNAVNIIQDMCLQNSVFGRIDEDGVFQFVNLPANGFVQSENNGKIKYGYYESVEYIDNYDETSLSFEEGRVWYPKSFHTDPEPDYGFTDGPPSSAQEAYNENIYYNRNSFFVGNTDWLDAAWQVDAYGIPTVQGPIFPICYGTVNQTDQKHLYLAQQYSLELRGNPLRRVGDTVEIFVRKTAADGTELHWTIHSYILSRTLKILGDTCMVDRISARNAPYNGNDQQLGTYTPEQSALVFKTRQERPIIDYGNFSDGTRAAGAGPDLEDYRCDLLISEADFEARKAAGTLRRDTKYNIVLEV